ncbi:MAG: dienelactone hydrolase family protein [Candidatus Dormiibacterota bacterium]
MTPLESPGGDTSTYIASAQPSPGAPVLLLHPWWGLNRTIRDLADRLAGDGFTVMAPDLFGGRVLTTPEEAKEHLSSLGDDTERVNATIDHLLTHPDTQGDRVGIIGLSFGAMYGTDVAGSRSDVAALVCFYSGIFEAPDGIPYLGHFAEDDEFDDSAQRPAFEKTLGEGSATYVYPGTKHWFLEADRPEYDRDATELAYARTVEFLREHLG